MTGKPAPGLGIVLDCTDPKAGKNRMHVDLEVIDIHAEVARLVALGATKVSEAPCAEHGSTWLLMLDPEGNELCVCDAGQGT